VHRVERQFRAEFRMFLQNPVDPVRKSDLLGMIGARFSHGGQMSFFGLTFKI
jgi:hypothetical protein